MSGSAATEDNRTYLEKADFALSELTSGSGVLVAAQAKQFMKIMIHQAVLLKECRVEPMRSPSELVEKTVFSGRILQADNDGESLAVGDRSKPSNTKVQLDAKPYKAEVRLTYGTLEDNIEGESLADTIKNMMAEAIVRDWEDAMINGDTSSTTPFYALQNGILKQATTNVVDSGVIPIARSQLKAALKTLPNEFLPNKREMRFYTSTDAEIDYRDTLADRATVAGDRYVLEDTPALYAGVPLVGIPKFPDNLNAGGGSNETAVIFTHPKNIHVGIWRSIMIERDRDISAGVVRFVARLRMAVKYDHEPAVVKIIKVKTQ